MKRDEILRIAHGTKGIWDSSDFYAPRVDDLERFAASVAEIEREACARLCAESSWVIGQQFAKAIRARGKA